VLEFQSDMLASEIKACTNIRNTLVLPNEFNLYIDNSIAEKQEMLRDNLTY